MAKLYNSSYFHRDLSWLRFNHRVLQEATDKANPLYERIKFLAIFSSNLDEFFEVRVSDIRKVRHIDKFLRKKLITQPNKVLKEIKEQVVEQQRWFGHIFSEEIIPELAKNGIDLISCEVYNEKQSEIALNYFKSELKQDLEKQQFCPDDKRAFSVENEALYLSRLGDKHKEVEIIHIPKNKPRFFVFPEEKGRYAITFIDDILKFGLSKGNKEKTKEYFSIKLSRDAELYLEDELNGEVVDKIKKSLSKRESGQATRLLYDQLIPEQLLDRLTEILDIHQADHVLGGRYHNFKDFFGFPNPTKKALTFPNEKQIAYKPLENADSVFKEIKSRDHLLHFPYHSFESVNRFIEEAAQDSKVVSIRMTLYRLAKESRLNNAIVEACKSGKKVTLFIEAKARFDEENNMKWGRIFEQNGAKVIYSYPNIKVHSKIILIERIENQKKKKYAYIGTGNFNEKTSKIYTDFALLTSKTSITNDLKQVFCVLEGKQILPKTKHLLVSPFTARSSFMKRIENEITLAKLKKDAYIILKLNSLQDKDMIKALYRASNAGVKIKLIIRGICCLVPGVKGQSENIEIISIVDQYLEHARVYIFGNEGQELVFLGSADWMTRNLDHRIEVITPVLTDDLKKQVKAFVNFQLNDNQKARIIDAHQQNVYRKDECKNNRAQFNSRLYLSRK